MSGASAMLEGVAPPLVVAHRGASSDFAEHTLTAYERAIEVGADALECDVRLTADGHLVCVHDATITRTSNGTLAVDTSTLKQLRRFDFASWKSGAAPTAPGEVAPRFSVLTLETLLDLATSSSRPVGLSIETKHPTRQSLSLERHVVEALRRFALVPAGAKVADPQAPGAVRMMSFSARALQRMRALAPTVPAVYLTSQPPARLRDGRLPFGAVVAGPGLEVLRADPDYVARVQSRGHRVHVWTVDEPVDVAFCVGLGVDGLITNRPAAVIRAVGRRVGEPGAG